MIRVCSLYAVAVLLLFPTTTFAQGTNESRPSVPESRKAAGDPTATAPRGKPKHPPRFPIAFDWDRWWALNGGSYLRPRLAAAKAARVLDEGSSCWGGASMVSKVLKVTKNQIRNDVLPILRLGLQDPDWRPRARSAIAIGKLVDAAYVDLASILAELRTLLRDPDYQVRQAACLGLGLIGDKSQVPDLILILQDDPKGRELVGARQAIACRLRAFAALAIGLIGSRETLDGSVIDVLTAAARGHAAESRPASRPR